VELVEKQLSGLDGNGADRHVDGSMVVFWMRPWLVFARRPERQYSDKGSLRDQL
jgi:hypothetical protein